MDSSDEEYEVEAIRDRRAHNGRIQYYIKWKGWPELSNTWEDESNLDNCQDLLAKFLKEWIASKKKQKDKKETIKFIKVVGISENKGKVNVNFLCSDKKQKSMEKEKAVKEYPGLYFEYLENHSAFRVET